MPLIDATKKAELFSKFKRIRIILSSLVKQAKSDYYKKLFKAKYSPVTGDNRVVHCRPLLPHEDRFLITQVYRNNLSDDYYDEDFHNGPIHTLPNIYIYMGKYKIINTLNPRYKKYLSPV